MVRDAGHAIKYVLFEVVDISAAEIVHVEAQRHRELAIFAPPTRAVYGPKRDGLLGIPGDEGLIFYVELVLVCDAALRLLRSVPRHRGSRYNKVYALHGAAESNRKRGAMEWFKLWVGFTSDPKWEEVPEENRSDAMILYLAGCEWAAKHETDGLIPSSVSFAPGALHASKHVLKHMLQASALWASHNDAKWLLIAGWLKRNQSVELMKKRREAGRLGGQASAQARAQVIKTKTKTKIIKKETTSPKKGEVDQVFGYWQERTGANRAVLSEKRRVLLRKALASYPLKALQQVVDGALKSPWHTGENDKGQKYLKLELLFRDSEKIEQFIEYDENPPRKRKSEFETELEQRMDEAKRRGSWN